MAAPREETLTLSEWAWRRCKETQPHPPCLPGPTKEKPQQHNQTLHHKKKATNYQPKLQQACTCKLTVPSTVMRTSPWEIGWDNSTTILPCTSSCKKRTHTKRSKLWDLFGTKLSEKAQNLQQDRTADRRGGRRVPMVGICGSIGGAWSRSTSGIRKSETARFLPRRRETGFWRERVCVRVLINWSKIHRIVCVRVYLLILVSRSVC